MKALFIIFSSLYENNGISKKISYQINALKQNGLNTKLCYVYEKDGLKQRRVDNQILKDYKKGILAKILKRAEFTSIIEYIKKEDINLVYIRSDHNANPFTINLVRNIHNNNIKIILEIPTFPYDNEYDSTISKIKLIPDLCFRNLFMKYIYRIVTFSDHEMIFNVPTIRISNGIDFSQIKLKQTINDTSQELHLIGVAEIHYWHGFDRIVEGLANYYKTNPKYKVYFHLVGNFFGERERNEILSPIKQHHLEDYILLHGAMHGEELDSLFEKADIAIGSLGRHRSGITSIKTLKNREYAARGLSFIFSEIDSDFEDKPYILKVPADETPIDIQTIITFFKQQTLSPQEIRNTIKSLSWTDQMKKVVNLALDNSTP